MSILQKFKENQEIIAAYLESNPQEFLLTNPKKLDKETLSFIANQIIARQKAKHKLPQWYNNADIIFPIPLSVEQASSELTAQYKASFVNDTLLDLTGGMGVDTASFAKKCENVIYLEKNPALVEIASHNFSQLNLSNIQTFCTDGMEYLKNLAATVDFIYIDPARRDQSQNKVYQLQDCEPNVLLTKEVLLEKAKTVFVKTSPMLDIPLVIQQLSNVKEVHCVAVENEVKELLFLLQKDFTKEPTIITINLTKKGNQSFQFLLSEESQQVVEYHTPQRYIYEPNAAVMKSGGFKTLAEQFKVKKIAPNTHLYTSDTFIPDFAGRTFFCEQVCRLDKKEVQEVINTKFANVSVRNFPLSAEEVKRKLGLKDGGEFYLFACENLDKQKVVLICRKAN